MGAGVDRSGISSADRRFGRTTRSSGLRSTYSFSYSHLQNAWKIASTLYRVFGPAFAHSSRQGDRPRSPPGRSTGQSRRGVPELPLDVHQRPCPHPVRTGAPTPLNGRTQSHFGLSLTGKPARASQAARRTAAPTSRHVAPSAALFHYSPGCYRTGERPSVTGRSSSDRGHSPIREDLAPGRCDTTTPQLARLRN